MVSWFTPDELPVALEAELQRLAPVECLLVEGSPKDAYQFPARNITITHCPAYFYQQEAAQQRLCRQFGVQSLEAYGCAREPQAIAAAGAIVAYLEKMNASLLSLLTSLRSYSTTNFMILDAHTQRNLELLQGTRSGSLQGSLLGVLDRTITPMGSMDAYRVSKSSMRVRLFAVALVAACKSWEIWNASPDAYVRERRCVTKCWDYMSI
jgi:DNA mismatch repair protein MutS